MGFIRPYYIQRRGRQPVHRRIRLIPPEKVQTLLLVMNRKSDPMRSVVQSHFPSARLFELSPRLEKKEVVTKDTVHTVHPSDFSWNGRLKNSRLLQLKDRDTDLLIDLLQDAPLTLQFLVRQSKAALKVGPIGTPFVDHYDCFTHFEDREEKTIHTIVQQLHKLTA